jgi:hypothetical protein
VHVQNTGQPPVGGLGGMTQSQFMHPYLQTPFGAALGNLQQFPLQNMHVVQVPISYFPPYGPPFASLQQGMPFVQPLYPQPGMPYQPPASPQPGQPRASQRPGPSPGGLSPNPSYTGGPLHRINNAHKPSTEPKTPSSMDTLGVKPAPENNSNYGFSAGPVFQLPKPVEKDFEPPVPVQSPGELPPSDVREEGGASNKVNADSASGRDGVTGSAPSPSVVAPSPQEYETVDVTLRKDEVKKLLEKTQIFNEKLKPLLGKRGLEEALQDGHTRQSLHYLASAVAKADIFPGLSISAPLAKSLAAIFIEGRPHLKDKMEEIVNLFRNALEGPAPAMINSLHMGVFDGGPVGASALTPPVALQAEPALATPIVRTQAQVRSRRAENRENFRKTLAKLDNGFAESLSNVRTLQDVEMVLKNKEALNRFFSSARKRLNEGYEPKLAEAISSFIAENPAFEEGLADFKNDIRKRFDAALKEFNSDAGKKT